MHAGALRQPAALLRLPVKPAWTVGASSRLIRPPSPPSVAKSSELPPPYPQADSASAGEPGPGRRALGPAQRQVRGEGSCRLFLLPPPSRFSQVNTTGMLAP